MTGSMVDAQKSWSVLCIWLLAVNPMLVRGTLITLQAVQSTDSWLFCHSGWCSSRAAAEGLTRRQHGGGALRRGLQRLGKRQRVPNGQQPGGVEVQVQVLLRRHPDLPAARGLVKTVSIAVTESCRGSRPTCSTH